MKRSLSLLFILLFLTNSYGQERAYVPFPTSDANWIYLKRNIFTSTNFSSNNNVIYQIGESDTIIDNTSYHTLYTNQPPYSYYCSYRENDKKIYVRFQNKTEDFLLYDFNLNLNDTMFYFFEDNMTNTNAHHKKVISIGSILLSNGEIRRTLTLASIIHSWVENEYWVEGIGSISGIGLFNPLITNTILNGDIFKFGFHCANDQVIYLDSNCSYCFCNSELSLSENPIGVITVFPNPFTNQFSIVSDNNLILNVEIYNSIGMHIKSETIGDFSGTINLENVHSGIYFIKINVENESIIKTIIKN